MQNTEALYPLIVKNTSSVRELNLGFLYTCVGFLVFLHAFLVFFFYSDACEEHARKSKQEKNKPKKCHTQSMLRLKK